MGSCHSCISAQSPRRSSNPWARPRQDEFIVNLASSMKDNIYPEPFSAKRFVFVSLIGLYQTWKKCPPCVLYTAIFIIPLKQKWIYESSKCSNQLRSSFMSRINSFQGDELKEFIDLLKWKDSQGLAFWTLDDYPVTHPSSLIAPFWYFVSEKLSTLYDNVRGTYYQPLNLNCNWAKKERIFGSSSVAVLSELYLVSTQYRAMQDIVYDSNPNSLLPVRSYSEYSVDNGISKTSQLSLYDEIGEDENASDWVIFDTYDPDEITTENEASIC